MLHLNELQEGQELPIHVKKPVTKVQLVKYAGASGDFNPLHTDDAFAQKIGLPGVIAHGMLVMGFLGEYVNKLAGEVALVKDFKMRFGAMTFPKDVITCTGTIFPAARCDKTRRALFCFYDVIGQTFCKIAKNDLLFHSFLV